MQPEHTYLAKMFNERVTDSISCVKTIRKHFLEEQLLGEAWINIVSRCYLRGTWSASWIRACRCCNWFVVERTEQVSLKSIALVLYFRSRNCTSSVTVNDCFLKLSIISGLKLWNHCVCVTTVVNAIRTESVKIATRFFALETFLLAGQKRYFGKVKYKYKALISRLNIFINSHSSNFVGFWSWP